MNFQRTVNSVLTVCLSPGDNPKKCFKNDPEIGRTLIERMSSPEELSGLLNRALEAYPVVVRGGITLTGSIESSIGELRRDSDPLVQWLDAETEEEPEAITVKRTLIDGYREYCRSNRKVLLSDRDFGTKLKRYRPKINPAQITDDVRRVWAYRGIRYPKAPALDALDSFDIS
jgi:hypothetical protein